MSNDGTTRRLCEAFSLLALLMGQRVGHESDLAVPLRMELGAFSHSFRVVLQEWLRGIAPGQCAEHGRQHAKGKDGLHGKEDKLNAHYKASQTLQGFVDKALQSWPEHKKRPYHAGPDSALPCLAEIYPALSTLQREQQRGANSPVLPSAAIAEPDTALSCLS